MFCIFTSCWLWSSTGQDSCIFKQVYWAEMRENITPPHTHTHTHTQTHTHTCIFSSLCQMSKAWKQQWPGRFRRLSRSTAWTTHSSSSNSDEIKLLIVDFIEHLWPLSESGMNQSVQKHNICSERGEEECSWFCAARGIEPRTERGSNVTIKSRLS